MIRLVRLAAIVAVASAMTIPAHAAPQGCAVVTPMANGSGDCRYTATGPGTYTASGGIGVWQIQISKDSGKTWTTVAGATGVALPVPFSSGFNAEIPSAGALPSVNGDLVLLTIHLQQMCGYHPIEVAECHIVRAGALRAADDA